MTRLLDITAAEDEDAYGAPNRRAWDAYDEFRLITDPEAELADLDMFLVDDLVEDFNDFDHDEVVDLAENYSE